MVGFTLLELLIGMTLLGFLLALLFNGFRLASSTWDTVSAQAETTANEQLARSFVRHLLEDMRPMRWRKITLQPITFHGEKSVLRAITSVPGPAAGGLRAVELVAATGDGNDGPLRLELRQAPLRYQAETFEDSLKDAQPHVLLERLESMEFQYFGSIAPTDPAAWHDAWLNMDRLPQLIRVSLRGKEAGAWADVVVAPVLSGLCTRDPGSGRCL